ncbi:MBL fold metallo-hydrolase [Carboxylicivirga caseinilyticus]|uniref:MBL fold metallo-hydrolase n=1 Tax=Carboxylicivirga caseinilyticus TaxID=3417572 RepID=UPI003D3275ED|nr:MBL fold metallo-hydrolase [Marinilabiliaceae bacterium A049]
MIEYCALASGSNGNCYYVGNENEAVLIDAGISRKQVLKRMKEVGLKIEKVKAVLISHEHSDHIRGLRVLSDLHKIDAYLTKTTQSKTRVHHQPFKVNVFEPGDVIEVGNIKVHSFAKKHDAVDPCSFRVELNGKSIGVMTDIGTACSNVKDHLQKCHAVFLESNYDEEMLLNGPYPAHLKSRVKSDHGHLSNDQAVKVVDKLKDTPLKTILLSHISADNNRPEIALKTFQVVSDRYQIFATSRYAPTEVFRLEPGSEVQEKADQLSLF